MPIRLKVTVDSEVLLRDLTRIRIALSDLRPAWDLTAVRIAQHIDERWSSPSDIDPLAESTLEAKRRNWGYYRRSQGTGRATGEGFTTR